MQGRAKSSITARTMALVLSLPTLTRIQQTQTRSYRRHSTGAEFAVRDWETCNWASVSRSLQCGGRFSCLFSNNRKQEQARKALESALGGKKPEFEKWSQEIKRREEAGGGGNSGGGGWFGWGGWFGGSDGDRFWQEAQQASLTILGLLAMYLVVTKGDAMVAVIFNPLLFALRWIRTAFTLLTSKIVNRRWENIHKPQEEVAVRVSAKDRVVGKWGSS